MHRRAFIRVQHHIIVVAFLEHPFEINRCLRRLFDAYYRLRVWFLEYAQ
jgi:hypothetical protein